MSYTLMSNDYAIIPAACKPLIYKLPQNNARNALRYYTGWIVI